MALSKKNSPGCNRLAPIPPTTAANKNPVTDSSGWPTYSIQNIGFLPAMPRDLRTKTKRSIKHSQGGRSRLLSKAAALF